MSSLPSGQGVHYDIRASLARFAEDLRKTEAMAAASAKRVRSETEKAAAKPVTMRFSADEQQVRNEVARALRVARQELSQKKLAINVEARLGVTGDLDAEARRRFAATGAAADTAATTEGRSTAGILKGASAIGQALGKVAKVAALSTAAVESAGVVWKAAGAAADALQGDLKSATDKLADAGEAAKALPLLGNIVRPIEQLLGEITGINDDIRRINEEIRKAEQEIARRERQIGRQQESLRAGDSFVAGLEAQAQQATMTEEQARAQRAAQERARLDELLRQEPYSRGGQLTDAGRALQARALAALGARDARQAEQADRDAAGRWTQSEIARLRIAGDTQGAERLEFDLQRQEAEARAAQVGREALAAEQAITAELREQLRIRQEQERAEKVRAENAQLSEEMSRRLREQAAEDERRRQQEQQAQDIQFETELSRLRMQGYDAEAARRAIRRQAEKDLEAADFFDFAGKAAIEARREAQLAEVDAQEAARAADLEFRNRQDQLRREGRTQEADTEAIMREAERALRSAGGDERLERAILERARGQLLDLQGAGGAEVVSASAARRMNFAGGGAEHELNKLNRTGELQLQKLQEIADKIGPPVAA